MARFNRAPWERPCNRHNEDIVYPRGFDLRQVPLFIDAIRACVPYDGHVDLSRFTTFDLLTFPGSR